MANENTRTTRVQIEVKTPDQKFPIVQNYLATILEKPIDKGTKRIASKVHHSSFSLEVPIAVNHPEKIFFEHYESEKPLGRVIVSYKHDLNSTVPALTETYKDVFVTRIWNNASDNTVVITCLAKHYTDVYQQTYANTTLTEGK